VASDPSRADVSPPQEPPDAARAAEELSREKQEVARLRSLLIARDAELGEARGRVLEFETRARYVLGAIRRLRALPDRARELVAGRRGPRG
jgi:hypothetical protein